MKPKVALIVTYPPNVHGGFHESMSYMSDAIKAVDAAGANPLLVASDHSALSSLKSTGHDATYARPTFSDRALEVADGIGLTALSPRQLKVGKSVEDLLRNRGVQAAIFLSPSWWGGALRGMPFATTVWDVGHLDQPSLPEVGQSSEFQRRERFLRGALRRSEFVVVPDEYVMERLGYWGFADLQRVVVRPFRAPDLSIALGNLDPRVRKLSQAGEQIAFYPAYYWPHKGHAALLEAMRYLDVGGPHLVLTGGDRANQLMHLAERFGVSDRVTILGSIKDGEVQAIYRSASVVVMPSLLGPTNLPPLEAWQYEVPLVYNKAFTMFTGEAAEYADPEDPRDLAAAIRRALDPRRSRELVLCGQRALSAKQQQSDQATAVISDRLARLLRRIQN